MNEKHASRNEKLHSLKKVTSTTGLAFLSNELKSLETKRNERNESKSISVKREPKWNKGKNHGKGGGISM
jgi:hypothetical protein